MHARVSWLSDGIPGIMRFGHSPFGIVFSYFFSEYVLKEFSELFGLPDVLRAVDILVMRYLFLTPLIDPGYPSPNPSIGEEEREDS